ncbi:class I SAM-dependent methyltransferase [Paraburkholderia sp. GAS334]|uniref:class I SAM-dependent methyltransferase n=1 Tax=Paraburkholderia sp. GAS334 TaxID=3035131 RepID=UPI003D1A4EDC
MSLDLVGTTCPVCAHSVAARFFPAGDQTLATLAWPASAEAARALPRHAQDFVQCPSCSHVWNHKFHYDAIPYESNPNRMFNSGGIWKGHLADTRDVLLDHLPAAPLVVEIGCGEGHFVRGLAQAREAGRFIGFDPNASPETGKGVEFHARLFDPLVDMNAFAPDAVVIRHVLEHLTEPAKLIEQLAWGAATQGAEGKDCWLFAEVPCIDRVFETNRLADFFYEHVSHFTTESFRTLMSRAGEIVVLEHGYDGEVVYALVKLGVPAHARERAEAATRFAARTVESRETIAQQLSGLAASGKRVAIWGGTGKAAAFIHQFGADAARFPLVVDSDPHKAGTYVPGTGQKIEFRDVLKTGGVDVIVIPTQWRARDIIAEMSREGIAAQSVMIEHNGALVDFGAEAHPY